MTTPAFARRLGGVFAVASASVLAFAAATAGGAGTAFAADAAHPVVVELFQSQGCSDCPPANANVLAIADRPDVLALSFQVTYWDQLGWKDTFGSKAYTDRQWEYANKWRRSTVATPEVVVNGRRDLIGSNRNELEQVIKAADRGQGGPRVDIEGAKVTVAGGTGGKADVWLVRYDPSVIQVPIKRGENGGKTLPHKNVVRELVHLGEWSGSSKTFSLPAGSANLKTAVLVQEGRGGAIVAAARV